MASNATCVLLRNANNDVLVVKNNNQQDNTLSKSLIPYQFYGLPSIPKVYHFHLPCRSINFIKEKAGLKEILESNDIKLSEVNDSHYKFVERIETPNFIDSYETHLLSQLIPACRVFNIDFYTYNLSPSANITFSPELNNLSYHLLPTSQLLQDFKESKLSITPDTLQLLQQVSTGSAPDLALEYSPGFHCFPILSNTIPPFKTTNLIVVSSEKSALIVDPGASKDGKAQFVDILQKLKNRGVNDLQVFITHHHKDHWEGLQYLADPAIFAEKEITILGHSSSLNRMEFKFAKRETVDGDVIKIGKETLQVVHTPGHTDGSLSLFHVPTR